MVTMSYDFGSTRSPITIAKVATSSRIQELPGHARCKVNHKHSTRSQQIRGPAKCPGPSPVAISNDCADQHHSTRVSQSTSSKSQREKSDRIHAVIIRDRFIYLQWYFSSWSIRENSADVVVSINMYRFEFQRVLLRSTKRQRFDKLERRRWSAHLLICLNNSAEAFFREFSISIVSAVGYSDFNQQVVSHTVEAGVHLWSLGVLTAAGCGMGSVHEVVRSNLLVDPSEILAIEEDDEQSKNLFSRWSQYKQSAVGLVFMESAAGLAMETSKVESAVRNQAEAKLNQLEHIAIQEAKKRIARWSWNEEDQHEAIVNQQLRRCARYGISCDDISLDVITISNSLYIQTQERSDVVEKEIQSQATVHQQILFGDSDSKTIFVLEQIQHIKGSPNIQTEPKTIPLSHGRIE
ncbi:hypothetical protein F511_33283 [Dorcoceras hygrometricum]|uniref:Uncharacterized protein n=1 Tax=Dorcoceras hygrometricum TaxID=472368 RepID=A0A2Z7CK76_9LAMI|nr:hypothetical protein F511_33283 [Dorcoceras hygrometricum]